MRRALGVAAVASLFVLVASTVAPSRAEALSCLPGPPRSVSFEEADLVLDAVALSGPRDVLELVRPARFYVLDYIKGAGPRVVRVDQGAPQVFPGDLNPSFGMLAGAKYFLPGAAYRFFAEVKSRRPLTLRRSPLCGPDTSIGTRGRLNQVGRASATLAGTTWSSRVDRDPRGGLRCLLLAAERRHRAKECGRASKPVLAIGSKRRAGGITSAVAVSAPRLDAVRVSTADGSVDSVARGDARIALATFSRFVDADELSIVARFRDGSERRLGTGPATARAPDPSDSRTWEAVYERGRGPNAGLNCVRWEPVGDRNLRYGECGRKRRMPFFLALRRAFRFDEASGSVVIDRRVVFGAIDDAVESVTVEAPSGTVEAPLSRRGRSFIVPLLPSDRPSEITVTFALASGGQRAFTGRRDVNVAYVPEAYR